MIKHFLSRQFVLFLMVGGTAAILHWLARFLLSFWVTYPLAVALAYASGIAVAFSLNRLYVFPTSKRPITKQARDFLLVNLAFFPVVWFAAVTIQPMLLQLGISIAYSEGLAHCIAIAIPLFITFIIYKFFTFGAQ